MLLGAIRALCRKNPELAEKATIEFSDFLRGNIDSLKADKPVMFTQELEHTKSYLSLEKLRFGDRLNIVYDLDATLFSIPTLTLYLPGEEVKNLAESGNVTLYAQWDSIVVNYGKVDNAIAKIPADLSIYTDASVKALNDAKNAVIRDKNITEQTIVDGYAATIEEAINGLVKKSVDTSAKPNVPHTGDNSILAVWMLFAVIASSAATVTLKKKSK